MCVCVCVFCIFLCILPHDLCHFDVISSNASTETTLYLFVLDIDSSLSRSHTGISDFARTRAVPKLLRTTAYSLTNQHHLDC